VGPALEYGASNHANALPIAFDPAAGFAIRPTSEVDVVADVFAAFGDEGEGIALTGPERVLDTRALSGPVPGEASFAVDVLAPADAVGVLATVTVIAGERPGYLRAHACGDPPPATSNLNFAAGAVVANTVLSPLGGGRLCLWPSVDVHLIVDVGGFVSAAGPLRYRPLAPVRLLDTREPTSLYAGRLGARQVIELPIADLPGMPPDVWGVVANLRSVGAREPGFLNVFPCRPTMPNTSSLNFGGDGAPVAALTARAVGTDGTLCVYASVRTHLIVDVLGVFTHVAPATPPDPGGPEIEDPNDGGDYAPFPAAEPDLDETIIDAPAPTLAPAPERRSIANFGGGCACDDAGARGTGSPLVLLLAGLALAGSRRRWWGG